MGIDRITIVCKKDGGAGFPGKEERRRDAISRALSAFCAAVKFFHSLGVLAGTVILCLCKSVTQTQFHVKGLF